MKTIEKLLCETMHEFVKEHISEIADTYEDLGFKNEKDMLCQIKRDAKVAAWALTELCTWGLGSPFSENNYAEHLFVCDKFINDNDMEIEVYKLRDKDKDRYVKFGWDTEVGDYTIHEVNKVTRMIEVTRWEEIN